MSLRRSIAALLFLVLFPSIESLPAQERVDPALFQNLRWRLLGPFRGGRVLAVAGVPGEREHFYFGSVNGGIWETRDAGRTWNPIFDGQPIGSIGALALAPSDPRILYAGTGEADMRSDISQGDGMYRSSDGGRTWAHIGLADSQQIGRILVHPQNPALVYVAALGHPYGPNAERGVFRSRDGGRTWQKVLGRDDDTGAIDLAFEPGNPQVLYAALWQTRRTPWSIYPPSNGPGSGLYKSTDGGGSWRRIDGGGSGMPERHGRIGLAVAPSAPQRVYAMVDAEPGGGLYRSDDGGTHWQHASSDTRLWARGWYFGGIAVDPKDPERIYALNTIVLLSDNGGKTFVPVQGDDTGDDFHEMWIDSDDPGRRILGTDQGAIITLNGGRTWSSWHNQPTGQFYHVSTDNRFPYWVYGSQQDSGAAAVPSRTHTANGITMMQFREVTAGGESDVIAPDPENAEIIFGGRVRKLDLRTGQTRDLDPTLADPGLHRRAWTLPLAFSRRDPRVLYFSNEKLYRTEDGGEHWRPISPDLTREEPGAPANLDPATAALNIGTARRGVIYSIAPSRLKDHDIWVGTDDGLIWRTRDEGRHWEDITPASLTPWSKVGIIEVSHFDAESAYAAIDRHRLDDFKPYIYRTHDGGRSWQLASGGIPAGSFVNVVREDPVRKGLLYAGTEKGVFLSFDDGAHWQPLQRGLPVSSVRDIDVHANDLVIATHGRAFWILDDVTPLRQIDGSVSRADTWLFAPAPAWRLRPAGFTGTPLPRDEPMAANPPFGAYVDYFLKAPAEAPIALEIRDARDEIVRRYGSDMPVPEPDLGKLGAAPEWIEKPSVLSAEAGAHRFVWPLRYPAPVELAGDDPYADGTWAPPGRYSVVLTVGGRRYTQPLTIEPDPRVSLPAGAYEKQFALARRIETARAQIAATRKEVDTVLKALAERAGGAEGPKLAGFSASFDTLRARLLALSGTVPAENPSNSWWLPPKSTDSLRWLASALDALNGAVDDADSAPSPDAMDGFERIAPKVEAAFASWQALKSAELAELNLRLEAAGQPPIEPEPSKPKPSGGR